MGSRADRLPTMHPLRQGFEAATKDLAGKESLSSEEREALARLKLAARAISSSEGHWAPCRERFIADLLHAEECKSILFELHVMTFGVNPVVRTNEWLHYSHASPDVAGYLPDMLVECKLVRSDKLFRIEAKLEEGCRQHKGLSVPYVVAVGFDHGFSRAEIDDILVLAESLKPWFEGHPDVAAGLIFTPAALSVEPANDINPLGIPGSVALHETVTEFVHHSASNPLPRGLPSSPGSER